MLGPFKQDRIYGVFSSQEIKKVGTGTTTRKTVSKIFWFVEEEEDGSIIVQSINANYVPTGVKKKITKEVLLEKYSPEPEFYASTVYPKMKELDDTLDKADESRKKGEMFSAEFEYNHALKIDIGNVRANFGIGLTYLERGDAEKAKNIFDRLVNLEGAYSEEHKHLFNEFGINLRKSKMYTQAVEYYQRALQLNKTDENIFINLARVYLELKQYDDCFKSLELALQISPKHQMASKFVLWLRDKNLITPKQFSQVENNLSEEQ